MMSSPIVHIETVEYHTHNHIDIGALTQELKLIHNKLNNIMVLTEQQFNDVFTRIDTSTTRIADRIRALEDAVKNEGLDADVEQRILSKATGIADALDAIGKTPETPAPEIPADVNAPITPAQ